MATFHFLLTKLVTNNTFHLQNNYHFVFQFDSKKLGETEISGGFRTRLLEEIAGLRSTLNAKSTIYNKSVYSYTESMSKSLDGIEKYLKENDFYSLHKETEILTKTQASINSSK